MGRGNRQLTAGGRLEGAAWRRLLAITEASENGEPLLLLNSEIIRLMLPLIMRRAQNGHCEPGVSAQPACSRLHVSTSCPFADAAQPYGRSGALPSAGKLFSRHRFSLFLSSYLLLFRMLLGSSELKKNGSRRLGGCRQVLSVADRYEGTDFKNIKYRLSAGIGSSPLRPCTQVKQLTMDGCYSCNFPQ